jgi:hypothetical protein
MPLHDGLDERWIPFDGEAQLHRLVDPHHLPRRTGLQGVLSARTERGPHGCHEPAGCVPKYSRRLTATSETNITPE